MISMAALLLIVVSACDSDEDVAVSYTHLDVYKRQLFGSTEIIHTFAPSNYKRDKK